jgi:putative exosortase-associated protein (TIGR04073 family)
MKKLLPILFFSLSLIAARADIHMPKGDNFYDKMGRGLANITMAPSEILDSQYSVREEEGDTAGFFKGMLVQGVSRMVMDVGVGLYEVFTSPFPPYESLKLQAYDTGVVNEYPPADLQNWY